MSFVLLSASRRYSTTRAFQGIRHHHHHHHDVKRRVVFTKNPSFLIRRYYLSTTTTTTTTTTNEDDINNKWTEGSLGDQIKHAFMVGGETDGILKLANISSTILSEDTEKQELVYQCIQSLPTKVMASGAINGFIGACSQIEDREEGAKLAFEILEAYDDMSEVTDLYPDLVTFALTYNALVRSREEQYHILAQIVLERAEQLGKRKGGSKKRRALVRERNRKGRSSSSSGSHSTTPAMDASELLKQVFDIQVLAETHELVIVNKPSGMACWHKKRTSQGKMTTARLNRMKKGIESNSTAVDVSLVDALLASNVPLSTLGLEGRGLVHRIDRGTSGCILLAKTNDMHARLVSDFFLRNCKKTYTAIVRTPSSSDDDDGKTDVDSQQSPPLLAKNVGEEGMIDIPVTGRPAKTLYQVTKRVGPYVTLELETITGRKHQVRVHCAKGLNSPVVLDPLHDDVMALLSSTTTTNNNNDNTLLQKMMKHQQFFLHATGLAIPSRNIRVGVPLPKWWKEAVAELEEEGR